MNRSGFAAAMISLVASVAQASPEELTFVGHLECPDELCLVVIENGKLNEERVYVSNLPLGAQSRFQGMPVKVTGTEASSFDGVRRIRVTSIRTAL